MPESSSFGYIFSSDELLYLLGLMGANYVLGVENGSFDISNADINYSLLEKGCLFRNFDNELILNLDVVKALKPMARLGTLISVKCNTKYDRSTVYFYSNETGTTANEVNISMQGKHVITYLDDQNEIYEMIKSKINTDECKNDKDTTEIEVGADTLRELKNTANRTDIYNILLSKGKNEYESGFLADFMSELKETYTVVLFTDIKNKPKEMQSLVFVAEENSIFKLKETAQKLTFKPISQRELKEAVRKALSECLHKEIVGKSLLFC